MASDSLHTVIRLFEKYIQPLHRQTARMFPPSAPPNFPKAFGRCRRGRSPSDFHSYPAALPTGRVVDFACKINSLQIRTTSGWPNLLPRKSGENHFCDTLKRQGKSSFPLALLYWMKNYFFTGVGVATELLPFPSPISCCINKKIPTPRSTSPTLAIPGNT